MGVDEVKTSFIRRPLYVLELLKSLPNVGLRSDSGPHSRLKDRNNIRHTLFIRRNFAGSIN